MLTNLLNFFKPKPLKVIFAENKEAILKLVASDHLTRTSHKDLKYEFTAQSGKRYYSFPEKMQLPFLRMAKGMEFMDWLKNGISPEDFDRIRHELTTCFAHMKAKTDQEKEMTTKAGLLIAELERRRVQALPYYVLINLVANYMIREDEDPQIISPLIHEQKCDEIQNEIETGSNGFFLTIPQLKPLSGVLNLSPDELTEYLSQLKNQTIEESVRLKAYLSWIEPQRPTKTSTKA